MSRLGAKAYTRKTDCKANIQFDNLLAEKGNKPSTAKVSVAAVHRWGMTSFTSLRKTPLNGQEDLPSDGISDVKRFKPEPNPVVAPSKDQFAFEASIDLSALSRPSSGLAENTNSSSKLSAVRKPKKFFKSSEGSRRNLASSTKSSRNDFDSLRLPISKNSGFVRNIGDPQVASSEKISFTPSGMEKSSRLFESLVQSEPLHTISQITVSDVSVSQVQSDSDQYKPVSYSDRVSDESLFLICDDVIKEQLPHTNILSSTNSDVLCDSESAFSDGLMFSSYRTCKADRLKNDESAEITQGTTFHEVQVLRAEHSTKDLICDSNVQSGTKQKAAHNLPPVQNLNTPESDIVEVKNEEKISATSDPSSSEQKSSVKNVARSKKIFNTSKKPKAVYNHRHWQSLIKEEDSSSDKEPEQQQQQGGGPSIFDELDDDQSDRDMEKLLHREIKQVSTSGEMISTVKCPRPVKQLYTVVRNVKQAYQCHESGETQEFNDDIEYLLDGLQAFNGIGTRCLSVLGLATKCMGPAFRVHLRAHGTMPKIFSALQDAPSDPNLSLCTATLLFVLSQDRLTMDIEASTLSMMLQLLETDPEIGSPEKELDLILEDPALCAMQEKHREKVYQLCEQMQQKGHAKHLKLDNINTGILATETLLSLTSRKAGEWFKEEMRNLHGLDHIVDTISSCVESLKPEETEVVYHPSESHLDKIRKIDRCLRVLENVTYMNFENQDYLLRFKDSMLVNYCLSLIKMCKAHLLENQPTDIESSAEDSSKKCVISPVLFCLLSVMKVLLNITFDNPSGCALVGGEEGLMENVLLSIFQVPKAVPTEKRFDLLVLSLGLMINLVEHCPENRTHLMEMYSLGSFDTINDGYEILASEALVEVLLSRLEAAQRSEEQADELLSSSELKHATEKRDSENAASQAECLEETLMKTLQKAGKHMEHSIIAAYISLLIGCTVQNCQEYADVFKDHIPDGKFDIMIEVLKKFMSFVSLTGVVGNTGVKSIQRIIEVLTSS